MARKVMIVDDSSPIRKFVMYALRSQGYLVLTALDGLDALEQLAREPVDLIITDLTMPKLDGMGLIRALKQDRELSSIPIIILSSLGGEDYLTESQKLGVTSYLVKPFDSKRIQYEVAKYLA